MSFRDQRQAVPDFTCGRTPDAFPSSHVVALFLATDRRLLRAVRPGGVLVLDDGSRHLGAAWVTRRMAALAGAPSRAPED